MNLSHPTIGFKDTGHKKAKMSWISFHARKLIGVLKTIQKKMFLEKYNFNHIYPAKHSTSLWMLIIAFQMGKP